MSDTVTPLRTRRRRMPYTDPGGPEYPPGAKRLHLAGPVKAPASVVGRYGLTRASPGRVGPNRVEGWGEALQNGTEGKEAVSKTDH